MKRRNLALILGAVATLTITVFAQTVSEPKPSFGVASIKARNGIPNRGPTGGGFPSSVGIQGCRFTATNSSLRSLLQFAYRPPNGQLPGSQIVGGPTWMDSDRFDIEAKPDDETKPIPMRDVQRMVQSLLEDRFQLKAHRDTREMQTYDLVVGKSGAKMKTSEDQTPATLDGPLVCTGTASGETPATAATGQLSPSGLLRGGVRTIGSPKPSGILLTVSGFATPLSTFMNLIQSYAGRPIVNKTDLTGLFDFELKFGLDNSAPSASNAGPPGGAPEPAGPSIFTAIQEQLGLKLESSKGPVDILVVDSAQKPAENGN
jgi:uncharacterized protein (TIGR03435 family)